MPGLDAKIIGLIDYESTISRISYDTRTDFIQSPHFYAIYKNAGKELWSVVSNQLRSGKFQPELPMTISVPKGRGFTRPGSILNPIDRFVYQALVDQIAQVIENEIDRSRTFSHIYLNSQNAMFKPARECWKMFDDKVTELCGHNGWILKTDISNYFDRIPHHPLINLIRATGADPGAINLLEEILSAFRERNSYGIIQGMFPSDLLGNFFLTDIDIYCEQNNIPSARYVDDIYMHFDDKNSAKRGLNKLIERLRRNGLHLNEYKSKIYAAKDLIGEKTAIDILFDEAKDEIETAYLEYVIGGYVFLDNWEFGEENEEFIDQDEVKLLATKKLYDSRDKYPDKSEDIEKFCLPLFHAAGSDYAIDGVLSNLEQRSHLARFYYQYLSRFIPNNITLARKIENIILKDEFITDYERMMVLGSLINSQDVSSNTVYMALRWFENKQIHEATRAVAAFFTVKHGSAAQKQTIRMGYDSEPSYYVKASLLYSSKFLPANKWVCKKAWGKHNIINELISGILD